MDNNATTIPGLVSIIIPHYNRAKLVSKAISSVEAQTYSNWEIIIVDDISEPAEFNTLQKVAGDRARVYQRETARTKGPSACRNIGIAASMGEFIIFLDSDDLLAPFCLEQRVKAMAENLKIDAGVFLMAVLSNEVERPKAFNPLFEEDMWIEGFLRNENPWNVTGPIWRKDALLKTGGFDESFFGMEDPELHLRALYLGISFKTFYDQPADSYYVLNKKSLKEEMRFYENSISYRIHFFEKLTSGHYSIDFLRKNKQAIKIGVQNLFRSFLFSRHKYYPDKLRRIIEWMKKSYLFSQTEILRYDYLTRLGNQENSLFKLFRIKGLCYYLLPKQESLSVK